MLPPRAAHQPGISTRQQAHIVIAAFDVTVERSSELRELLITWSAAAGRLMTGRRSAQDVADGRLDTGEAHELSPANLTLTFGLGPALFACEGEDRLGLGALKPAALRPLPAFPGDALDAHRSDGDLCVQVCADDPQVAFHALHTLSRLARGPPPLPGHRPGSCAEATSRDAA